MNAKAFEKSMVLAGLTLFAGVALANKGHKAHEHGAVSLNVAIDGTSVSVGGEIPGDDAFGFEHVPRNDQEKAAVKKTLATLRTQGTELFQFPADAGCTVKSAEIKSPLEAAVTGEVKPEPKGKKGEEEHQDVDADYLFNCQKSPAGGTLKLGLLKSFPSIKTVRVQVISGSNQSGVTVHSADDLIHL